MLEFNQWLFNTEADLVGHSLWFKSYFNEFMPRAADSRVKKEKLPNCGMVEFVVQRISDETTSSSSVIYHIDKTSVIEIKWNNSI
jgi:hypothetical protein